VIWSATLSPRGQDELESSASDSASKNCLRPRHVLELLFWPRENECADGTDSHCEFAMIIYQSCLPCVNDINLFKFTFTVVFNYLGVDEVYIGYLWARGTVFGLGFPLKGLSSFNITGSGGEKWLGLDW